ncbi:SGNH/GDSL hydrolase family protein [Methylovirgula sp. 4M-Z18]|uniref:SGNH/GDSL hydrolase family protein n=1 Tax=Methylovirgula sp. 4M-Z18 TaxID=2293567 RepID=UPI000E2FE0F8|nr:SGNH family hydrolase [Methylovirgula sp. 4M-Z18]RFB78565.1 DUF459 domain-containing protein [Methylovirgula sp. 4M-Z18]
MRFLLPLLGVLSLAILFLCWPPMAPVRAEGDNGGARNFWFQEQQRQSQQPKPRVPQSKLTRPAVTQPRYAPDTPAQPKVEPTFFVDVFGDSLAYFAQQGLQDSLSDRPEVAVQNKARESSGLVRDDFYDWPKSIRDLLAGSDKITYAVIMIGLNDHQPLKDASGTYDPLTPQWREIYVKRAEDIAQQFHDKKIPLIWVGLPIMSSDKLSADAVAMNEIFKGAAEKNGAAYVDIWNAFADDSGHYSANGPDVNGQPAKLRTNDGIHFTKAGALKLASFIDHDIRNAVDEARKAAQPDLVSAPGLPQSSTQQPVETVSQPAPAPLDSQPAAPVGTEVKPLSPEEILKTLPLPPAADVVLPQKPAAGPVLALTAAPLALDGTLAQHQRASAPNGANRLTTRVLVDGRPLDPKPGRADDFAWPQP